MTVDSTRRALLTGPHPPGSSRLAAFGGSTTGSLVVAPSCLACRTRPVWQSRTVPSLSGLLPPSLAPPRSAAPSFSRAAATAQRWVLSSHPVTWRLVAHGLVRVHLVWPPEAPAVGHQDRWDVVQHRLKHGGVVGVGGTQHDRKGKPPALAHSSSRRQHVVALPHPSSLTGSKLQGVEVRAMKLSAATQLRPGTRHGTPSRGRGGGGGSRGWMRCHSSSGRSLSTRLVMPGTSQGQLASFKPHHRAFRNVLLVGKRDPRKA
jgi:hypothetical protein